VHAQVSDLQIARTAALMIDIVELQRQHLLLSRVFDA
jgi:hypothetical protein